MKARPFLRSRTSGSLHSATSSGSGGGESAEKSKPVASLFFCLKVRMNSVSCPRSFLLVVVKSLSDSL